MAKRIDWWEVLYLFCWGLDKLARPTLNNMLAGYEEDCYRTLGPGLWHRLVKDEYLARTGRGTSVTFSITEKGRKKCAPLDPTVSWNRTWDNRWRLVTFDIPESRRKDRLMLWRELRARRLGLLQRSVWVWPHDIEGILNEVVNARGIPECFAGFECERLFLCTREEIVRTGWDFEAIAKDHEVYLKRITTITNHIRNAENLAALARWGREERFAFDAAMLCDPMLPRVLWPKGYQGEGVYQGHQAARAELSRRLPKLVRQEM